MCIQVKFSETRVEGGGAKPSNMGLFKQEQVLRPNLAAGADVDMPDIYAFYADKSKDEVIDRIKERALRDQQIQLAKEAKEERQRQENLEQEKRRAEQQRQLER